MKKKRMTSIVSLRRGILVIKAPTITLSPSIPLMVLKGLRTLKDLKALIFVLLPENIYGKKPVVTIVKSSTFHPFLK